MTHKAGDTYYECEPTRRPWRRLCWKQQPGGMVHCNREEHGPDIHHTWEMTVPFSDLELSAMSDRLLDTIDDGEALVAFKEIRDGKR